MRDFIYVCTEEDRDILLKHGFTLLRSDPSGSIYIFLKDGLETFDISDVDYVETDTLLF